MMRTARFFLSPIPPSMNKWMRMGRMQMQRTAEEWKIAAIKAAEESRAMGWWDGRPFDQALATYQFGFHRDVRHDPTNNAPKFIEDGLVAAGVLVDDDFDHYFPLLTAYRGKTPVDFVAIWVQEQPLDLIAPMWEGGLPLSFLDSPRKRRAQ